MGAPVDRLLNIIADIYREVRSDVAATREDPVTKLFSEVYKLYYRGERLRPREGRIGFVDAGFKTYAFDVMSLSIVQVGGLIRLEDGSLHPVSEFLDAPYMDTYIIYVTRRRETGPRGPRYVFRMGIKTPEDRTLLLGTPREVEEASRRVSATLSEMRMDVSYRDRARIKKITNYLEGLLELAYAAKVMEEIGGLDYVCLDGTLIRWFSIHRGLGVDGLDILASLLGVESGEALRLIGRIVGLSKKTSLLSVVRARSVLPPGGRGYANVDISGGFRAAATLNMVAENGWKYMGERVDPSFLDQAIHILNRPVFPVHGVWVARFPVTMDGGKILILDVYSRNPVMTRSGDRYSFNPEAAKAVGGMVEESVNKLYMYTEPLEAMPPLGFMKIDEIVRLRKEESGALEAMLFEAAARSKDPVAESIAVTLASSMRMRYGYRAR